MIQTFWIASYMGHDNLVIYYHFYISLFWHIEKTNQKNNYSQTSVTNIGHYTLRIIISNSLPIKHLVKTIEAQKTHLEIPACIFN